MKAQGSGSIISVSPVAALIGRGGPFAYTASKGGPGSMTKHVAVDCGRFGIRSNSIHPRGVRTPMVEEDMTNPRYRECDQRPDTSARHRCTRRNARPDLFLAWDECSYLTTAKLSVDGGLVVN